MIKIYLCIILCMPFIFNCTQAQSDPKAHILEHEPFHFTDWPALSTAKTYPQSIMFHQINKLDMMGSQEATSDWTLEYNMKANARFVGLDYQGIGFLNTTLKNKEGLYPYALVIALNTENKKDIAMKWTYRTAKTGERSYCLKLQYRIDPESEFQDLDNNYYSKSTIDSSKQEKMLPKDAENQKLVHLRWIYCYAGNKQGTRPMLAIDDISIEGKSSSIESKPALRNLQALIKNNHIEISFQSAPYNIIRCELYDIFAQKYFDYQRYITNSVTSIRYPVPSHHSGALFLKISYKDHIIIRKLMSIH